MDHRLLQQVIFWTGLLSLDQELAEEVRLGGCSCGGVLHRADFRRKPRGGPPNLPAEYCYRFSFCCNREGCRKRVTPPSVRFLGRKVYLHAVIILVAALRQGATPRRVRLLAERFEIDGAPSPVGRSFGRSSFRRPRSGRSHAASCCPW